MEGGAAVAAAISEYVAGEAGRYDLVVATRDWHVDPGPHFAPAGEAPDYRASWPPHCVAGTDGADWHPALRLPAGTVVVSKGERAAAFSGFEGRTDSGADLRDILQARGVDSVDVVGIATSYCVRATALDSVAAGFDTRVLTRLVADVDPAQTPASLDELSRSGVRFES